MADEAETNERMSANRRDLITSDFHELREKYQKRVEVMHDWHNPEEEKQKYYRAWLTDRIRLCGLLDVFQESPTGVWMEEDQSVDGPPGPQSWLTLPIWDCDDQGVGELLLWFVRELDYSEGVAE